MSGPHAPDAAPSDGRLRRVLANTGMLLGGRTVNAGLSLAYIALAARALGASQLGILVLINAFAQVVGEVAKFQSWQTVLQYGTAPLADGQRDQVQRVIRFSVILDLLSTAIGLVVGVAGAILLGPHLGWPAALTPVAALYALSIAFMVPATPVGLLRLFDRFDLMASQAAISSAVRLAGSAAGFLLGSPLDFFLAVWAAGTVAGFVYLAVVCGVELHKRDLTRGFSWRGPLTLNMPGAWRFAWATNFSSSLDVAFTHVATLAVGGLLGPTEAALWRVARQVADALAKPAKLLVPALYPELAKLRTTEGEQAMVKLAGQVGLVGGAVASVLLVVTIFAGGPLLSLVMGPAFASGATIMTWQVAAAVIGIWALPLEPMLISLGHPGAAVRVRLVVCAVYLATLVPVISEFGVIGAGAALVGASAALALGLLWYLIRALPRRSATAKPH